MSAALSGQCRELQAYACTQSRIDAIGTGGRKTDLTPVANGKRDSRRDGSFRRFIVSKKLPRGLQEYENTLDELSHTHHLLCRLRDLPGWKEKTQEEMVALTYLYEDVHTAESRLAAAKLQLRNHAKKIWQETVKSYSIKELQEATGYDQ